jgi:hypothetical protein
VRAFRNVMVPGAIVLALATCGGSLDMSPRPDHLVPWLRARDTPADVLGCQVVVRLLGEYRGKHGFNPHSRIGTALVSPISNELRWWQRGDHALVSVMSSEGAQIAFERAGALRPDTPSAFHGRPICQVGKLGD